MRVDGVLEYTRNCKVEGSLLARILAFLCLYAIFGFACIILWIFAGFVAFAVFGVITVSVVAITKPFFVEQRDYEIAQGSFRIYKIYGNSLCRRVFECELRSMERIVPLFLADAEELKGAKNYLSDRHSSDAYFAVCSKNGERCAVIFDGDEKFYAAAAFYARRAFHRS